jgi:hypothetical integral membrane protein (TIGR02206 family)
VHPLFVPFGAQHLAVIALTVAVPLALAALARRRGAGADRRIRAGFVALLIANQIAWYALFYARGWLGLGNVLQLNLCDWALAAVLVALVRGHQLAFELAYYWALAGTSQGVVTPDVTYAFPEPQFVVFMLGHADIVAAVLYLVFGTGMRPGPSSVRRAVLWTLGYAAAASLADWVLGVNYGFFRAKPTHATLFDLMPPWPWYIAEVVAIGIVATALLYLPWYLADRARKAAVPVLIQG